MSPATHELQVGSSCKERKTKSLEWKISELLGRSSGLVETSGHEHSLVGVLQDVVTNQR